MSISYPASVLEVDLEPGKPAVLHARTTGDLAGWATEHRDRLRAVLTGTARCWCVGSGCESRPRLRPCSTGWLTI